MVVGNLILILSIYLAIGCLIGLLMTGLPTKPQHTGKVQLGLFFLLVIGWFPLAVLAWVIIPFARLCPCFSRL